MPWYDPDDHSAPVIDPVSQIKSKYPGMQVPVLPARAVVFCLGKGIPVLKEHYSCFQIMEKLPDNRNPPRPWRPGSDTRRALRRIR